MHSAVEAVPDAYIDASRSHEPVPLISGAISITSSLLIGSPVNASGRLYALDASAEDCIPTGPDTI